MQAKALYRLVAYMHDRGGRVCDQSATRDECLLAWGLPLELPPKPMDYNAVEDFFQWEVEKNDSFDLNALEKAGLGGRDFLRRQEGTAPHPPHFPPSLPLLPTPLPRLPLCHSLPTVYCSLSLAAAHRYLLTLPPAPCVSVLLCVSSLFLQQCLPFCAQHALSTCRAAHLCSAERPRKTLCPFLSLHAHGALALQDFDQSDSAARLLRTADWVLMEACGAERPRLLLGADGDGRRGMTFFWDGEWDVV